MTVKIKVRLIPANSVKAELRMLDRAEADRNCKSKAKAIAVAKKCVRESVGVRAMSDADVVRQVSPREYQVYKDAFRDVGENTFIFDEKTMKSACSQLLALALTSIKGTK